MAQCFGCISFIRLITTILYLSFTGIWWANMKPWYGYLGGESLTIQNFVLILWVLPLIIDLVIIIFIIVGIISRQQCLSRSRFFLFPLILYISSEIITFVIGTLLIYKTTDGRCNIHVSKLKNYTTYFQNSEQIVQYEEYIKKQTQTLSSQDANTWMNQFYDKTCKKGSKLFIIFLSIQLLISIISFILSCHSYRRKRVLDKDEDEAVI